MTQQADSSPRIFTDAEVRHLLAREVQRCTRYQDFLSVCLIRADYPVSRASELRAGVAGQIAEMLRSTDIVGTVGQDIIVLLVHTPDTDASIIVDRIRARLLSAALPGTSGMPPVSIGLASFPTSATDDSALLAQAQAQLRQISAT